MKTGYSKTLPLVTLPRSDWYRCVPRPYARVAPRASTTPTRFNDGTLRVLYFAPNALVAGSKRAPCSGRSSMAPFLLLVANLILFYDRLPTQSLGVSAFVKPGQVK